MTSYSTISPLGLSGPCQAKVTLSLLRLSFSTTLTAAQEEENSNVRASARVTLARKNEKKPKKPTYGGGEGGESFLRRTVNPLSHENSEWNNCV